MCGISNLLDADDEMPVTQIMNAIVWQHDTLQNLRINGLNRIDWNMPRIVDHRQGGLHHKELQAVYHF